MALEDFLVKRVVDIVSCARLHRQGAARFALPQLV